MTKTFMVDSEVYVAVAGRYRCIRGVDVPAGIDLSKIYGWYEVESIRVYDTWEKYNQVYESEASIGELEYNFFKKMFSDTTLRVVVADTPTYVDGYITQGSVEGDSFIIICILPLVFDTAV